MIELALPISNDNIYRIFVSYASEDEKLATEMAELLRNTFPRNLHVVTMKDFRIGGEWRQDLDKRIEETDMLILVFTGALKRSHGWTGYEVGSFSRDIKYKPQLKSWIERTIVPINYLGQQPDFSATRESVSIPSRPSLEAPIALGDLRKPNLSVSDLLVIGESYMRDIERKISDDDPLFTLLCDIASSIEKLAPTVGTPEEKKGAQLLLLIAIIILTTQRLMSEQRA